MTVILQDWYDRHIAVRLPNDANVFRTQITWVHDLPPRTVWFHNVEFESHISPELLNISDVFIRDPLPPHFHSTAPRCLILDVSTGEWFCLGPESRRMPVIVQMIEKKHK